jgi:peptidoglycan/xylan/chitin deacetylase (PgdA/CDA1 family)
MKGAMRLGKKALLKEALVRVLNGIGLTRAIRALLWRDRVAILLYHDPNPETLDRHMSYLSKFCDFVPLEDFRRPGKGRPRATITLDDGHAGNAQLLKVFMKYKVRPTIFLCSQIVGRPRMHWWMHPGAERAGLERLKRQSNGARVAELEQAGFLQDGDEKATGLTADQIEQMRPFVDFQSHTRFHPILTRCADIECEEEIAGSRQEVEALVNRPCEHLAFPNGNYGPREIEFARAAGYKTARTCDVGWNDQRTDPFRLRAMIIDDHASTAMFAVQLTGIPRLVKYYFRSRRWDGRFPQF